MFNRKNKEIEELKKEIVEVKNELMELGKKYEVQKYLCLRVASNCEILRDSVDKLAKAAQIFDAQIGE